MTADETFAPPAPRGLPSPWKRFLWIGLMLFVAAAVFLVWFWPKIELRLAINGLATTDQRVLGDLRSRLRESADPATDDRLAEAAADGDKAFLLRRRCAELLILRNRLVRVETLARSDDLMTRAVALKVLSQEEKSHFIKDYVPAPEYRVEETVRAWLGDAKREARHYAIGLALLLSLPDAMEQVRPLLDRRSAEGAGRSDANETLVAAIEAAVQFKDCASVPSILTLASGDPEWDVRRASIDAVETLCLTRGGEQGACPEALPPERLASLVDSLLDAPGDATFTRSARISALYLMGRHPELLAAHGKRVWAALDGPGNGAERRAALAALVAAKDPGIAAVFTRYFHDENYEVRSTAVQVAEQVEGLAPESLWIGILRDETRSFAAVKEAQADLERLAKMSIGLPEALASPRLESGKRERELERFIQEQMSQGTSMGVDREAWATAWFRWYAGSLGLEKDALERAVGARKAFRAAMDRSDAAAARAALAAVPDAPAPLFQYEQAWLATRP